MSKKKLIYFSKYVDEEINNVNLDFLISEKDVQYGFWYWITYGCLISLEEHRINLNDKKQMFHLSQRFRRNVNETINILETLVDYELMTKDVSNDDIFVSSKDVFNEIDVINKKSLIAKGNANKRWNDKTTNQTSKSQNESVKPVKTQSNDTLDKDLDNKQSPYYCNPRYKREREILEHVINDVLEIIPDFYGKNAMQKSALKSLFDMINNGIISTTANVEIKQWLTFRAEETKEFNKNSSFMLSDYNNLIIDIILGSLKGINQNNGTHYSKKDVTYIRSKQDGYFADNSVNISKFDDDVEAPKPKQFVQTLLIPDSEREFDNWDLDMPPL